MNYQRQRIRSSTWQIWMGQWAELLQSGMPVLDSLQLSSELQNNNVQGRLLFERLQRTMNFLRTGQSLQTAFRAACGVLPVALEVALMCGQASGDLSEALNEQLQRWRTTRDANIALGRSLIYPGVVLTLAVACWLFLHHVSSPHLPAGNAGLQNTLGASDFLLIVGAALLGVIPLSRLGRKKDKSTMHFLMPHKAWLASNFYHVIACELNAGLDLVYCLRHRNLPLNAWLGQLNPNRKMLNELNDQMAAIQRCLQQGMGLGQAMQQANVPDFLIRQSRLAEQTGNLAYCFSLAAKVYEMHAKGSQIRLQNLLPPIALGLSALTLAMAYQFTLAPLYGNLTGLS